MLNNTRIVRRFWPATMLGALTLLLLPAQADLNPAAIAYKLPNQIEWKDSPVGA